MITKTAKNGEPAANTGNHEPTHEEIALRAYLIWEKNGKPQAREREYWMQAEAELRSERKKPDEKTRATTATTPRPRAKAPRSTGLPKKVKEKRWQDR